MSDSKNNQPEKPDGGHGGPNPKQHHNTPLGHVHHAYGMYEAGNHVKEGYHAGKEGKHLKQAWHVFAAGLLCFFCSPVFLVFGVTAPLRPLLLCLGGGR